ncbi:Sugar transporter [Musa troglodytarum]|uniref:Sugar transporter n=1 Tax=Musa troglodytarum TaxID=320322 RepID=A0A9E7EJN6_9LILI|nr:Sugar transporter [Musa troglodytarum]URD78651.1 Sugar transporter [Musa troglodytarum]
MTSPEQFGGEFVSALPGAKHEEITRMRTYACIIFDFDPPLLPMLAHPSFLMSSAVVVLVGLSDLKHRRRSTCGQIRSKRVMAWGVVFWSIATFLTPWAARHSTAMLLAVRALFGLAEGVAIPSMSTHLFRWFPCNERASAVGIAMAGFHLGNVMSLLVSPIILSSVGINGTFAFFASLGFVWLSAWIGRIPNDPRDSPDISHSELQLIRAGKIDSKAESSQLPPLRHLFSKLPALAVVLANVANNWGYFVLLSWMPVYFKTVYNVNLKQAAWFSAVPFGVMALSGYLAGASSDLMIKSGCSIIHVLKAHADNRFYWASGVIVVVEICPNTNISCSSHDHGSKL